MTALQFLTLICYRNDKISEQMRQEREAKGR